MVCSQSPFLPQEQEGFDVHMHDDVEEVHGTRQPSRNDLRTYSRRLRVRPRNRTQTGPLSSSEATAQPFSSPLQKEMGGSSHAHSVDVRLVSLEQKLAAIQKE